MHRLDDGPILHSLCFWQPLSTLIVLFLCLVAICFLILDMIADGIAAQHTSVSHIIDRDRILVDLHV